MKELTRESLLKKIIKKLPNFLNQEEISRLQKKKKQLRPGFKKSTTSPDKSQTAGVDGNIQEQFDNDDNAKNQDQQKNYQSFPVSQPLTKELKNQLKDQIDLFGLDFVQSFNSQDWSSRLFAVKYLQKTIPALVQQKKQSPSTLKDIFVLSLKVINKGINDAVLKIFIVSVDLFQIVLPCFMRNIRQSQIKRWIDGVIVLLFQKMKDLRPKCRQSAISGLNFLSHQSPIGPQYMCNFILKQLEKSNKKQKQLPSNFQKAISNSSFWSSSLKLLAEFQKSAHICTQPNNQKNAKATLLQMMSYINQGLLHTALSVRDAALELYIVLFQQKGRQLESLLSKDLKPIIVTKLKQATHQARRIAAENEALQASGSFSMSMASKSHDSIYKNCLNYFKSRDPKRRIKGLIYVKKKFNSDTMQTLDQEKAREIWQNISNVLRSYLSDSDVEIYLQSIKLLQSALSKVVKLLNSFDLLISLSSLITLIIQKIIGGKSNMRCQIASDKVLLHMSKIPQIGAPVILRDMISALEKQTKSNQINFQQSNSSKSDGDIGKILGIINSLVSHFGDDIINKGQDMCGMLLNALGMALNSFKDSNIVSNIATQIVTSLYG